MALVPNLEQMMLEGNETVSTSTLGLFDYTNLSYCKRNLVAMSKSTTT